MEADADEDDEDDEDDVPLWISFTCGGAAGGSVPVAAAPVAAVLSVVPAAAGADAAACVVVGGTLGVRSPIACSEFVLGAAGDVAAGAEAAGAALEPAEAAGAGVGAAASAAGVSFVPAAASERGTASFFNEPGAAFSRFTLLFPAPGSPRAVPVAARMISGALVGCGSTNIGSPTLEALTRSSGALWNVDIKLPRCPNSERLAISALF